MLHILIQGFAATNSTLSPPNPLPSAVNSTNTGIVHGLKQQTSDKKLSGGFLSIFVLFYKQQLH